MYVIYYLRITDGLIRAIVNLSFPLEKLICYWNYFNELPE